MSTPANRTLIGAFVLLGLALTLAFLVALGGGWLGARLACRVRVARLQAGFTALLLLVAGLTGAQALPVLL